MKQYLIPFLVGVAFIALGIVTYQIGHGAGYAEGINQPHKPDTVWREKTVYVDKPVEVVKWKDREKPIYVPVNKDSLVYVHDTTYIALEREYKLYDGENYQAQVSGIDPALDWLKVNQQTAYITNTIEKPTPYKWSLSAFGDVGYPLGLRAGLTFDKQAIGPLRWYVQGGYEYNPSYKGVFVQGGVKLEILEK